MAIRLTQPAVGTLIGGTLFLSHVPRPATIRDDGTFASVTTDGLFRTEGEIRKQNAVRETVLGAAADIVSAWGIRAGVIFLRSEYSKDLAPVGSRGFRGRRLHGVGGTIQVRGGPAVIRADMAWSGAGEALSVDLQVSSARSWSVSCAYSVLSPGFLAPFVDAAVARGRTANVEALGLVCRLEQGRHAAVRIWAHGMRRLWKTTSVAFPGTDGEAGCDMDILCGRHVRMRYKVVRRWDGTVTDREGGEGVSTPLLGRETTTGVKAEVILNPVPGFHARTCWEGSLVSVGGGGETRNGFLLSQEAGCTITGGLTVRGRVSVFDTDGTDTRQYIAETDGTGFWWNPPRSGRGVAWWFTLRWQPVSWGTLVGAWGEEEREVRGYWSRAARFGSVELILRR
jgi:hypothetical protein